MKKICVVGGPSSGKTTAALFLNVKLRMMGYEVHMVTEYATHYIIRNGVPKNVFEQIPIYICQVDEEGYVEKKGGDFLICDSASFLACVYARHYLQGPNATREDIQKYYYVLKTLDKWSRERTLFTYDFIFFLPLEIEFKKDNVRWQNSQEEAQKISDEIEAYLTIESKQYFRISGSLEERVGKMLQIIRETEEKAKNPPMFPLIE